MDTPMSPAGKALVEYVNERKGKTKTDREHFRRNVLSCSKKDLIRAGEQHLKADVHTVAITSETIVKRDQPGNATNPFRIIPI
jgi:Zn-dependent M16 (insulinase) family peptidase